MFSSSSVSPMPLDTATSTTRYALQVLITSDKVKEKLTSVRDYMGKFSMSSVSTAIRRASMSIPNTPDKGNIYIQLIFLLI